MPDLKIASEADLVAVCFRLGARREPTLNVRPARRQRTRQGIDEKVAAIRRAIERGEDLLGEALCSLRSPEERRPQGATYTPLPIAQSMMGWAKRVGEPERVVDPGTGSGRFLLEAARAFPRARLVGVEIDPVAATVARANLCAAGISGRAEVMVGDYRCLVLAPTSGQTLFIGNPPYVRHHDIPATWKRWLTKTARERGLPVSQLAGLHLHFLVATLVHAREGDVGTFITAAEWLDVNYGALARSLFAGPLGVERIDLIEPAALPFADAQTTGVITSFQLGANGPVRVRRVSSALGLGSLSGGRQVSRERLNAAERWSLLSRPPRVRSAELVELGELCRVHRGQVTGSNRVWIAGERTPPLPSRVLHAAITRARELFGAGEVLGDDAMLRRVIDLPAELSELDRSERRLVDGFLRWARAQGANGSYIARHRTPWWSIKLRAPAPILATYMARRPPAFVRNKAQARHINIAHGIYPRIELSDACLDGLARYLAEQTSLSEGRTYAGGLTKFEPREMERLLVPRPEALAQKLPGAHAA